MKKRFSKIFLLLVLVLIVASFGCKGAVDLDMSKVKKWNNLQSITGKDTVQCINLVADNEAIDWWIITDVNGVVLEPGVDYNFVNEKGQTIEGTESAAIAKGNSIWLKFTKTDDVVVWIYQPEVKPKEGEKGSKDFRGRVNIEKSQGFTVKASSYREEVQPVCTIKLTCNETGSVESGDNKVIGGTICKGGNWSGDYEITEIWPLSQEEGSPQITAESGLKFIFDEDNYIEEGAVRRIVFPANKDIILALCQPNRLTDIERQGTPNLTNDVGKGYYDAIKDFKTNGELHDSLWWCYKLSSSELTAHTVKPMNSYDCNYRFVLTTNTIYEKSALGATYIINESDIVDGSDIK